jgi:hypothetical protein
MKINNIKLSKITSNQIYKAIMALKNKQTNEIIKKGNKQETAL